MYAQMKCAGCGLSRACESSGDWQRPPSGWFVRYDPINEETAAACSIACIAIVDQREQER